MVRHMDPTPLGVGLRGMEHHACLRVRLTACLYIVSLARLAMMLELSFPTFPVVLQQEAGSVECGVFVFAYMTMRKGGADNAREVC